LSTTPTTVDASQAGGWAHEVYYTSVDRNALTPLFRLMVDLLCNLLLQGYMWVEIQTDVFTVAADQSFLSFVYSPVLPSVGFCFGKSEVYFYWPLCGEGNAIGRVRFFLLYLLNQLTLNLIFGFIMDITIAHRNLRLGFGFRNGKVALVVTRSVWHRSSIEEQFF